jgi:hypothetical protein
MVSTEQMEIARLKAELATTRRYAFVEHRKVWPMGTQCRALNVSASGYRPYRARQKRDVCSLQPGRRIGDATLLVHVKAIFN